MLELRPMGAEANVDCVCCVRIVVLLTLRIGWLRRAVDGFEFDVVGFEVLGFGLGSSGSLLDGCPVPVIV